MEQIKELFVDANVSIKQAWKKLNDNGYKALFVVATDGKLLGSVSDGDVRRWILNDGSLMEPIHHLMNTNPITLSSSDRQAAKQLLLQHRIECIPVLNRDDTIREVIFWSDLFEEGEHTLPLEKLELPVVIMAGGRGERLNPFTRVLPKPLIPIGEKPVIELIMERFGRHGVREFHISVNYKANMIRAYFQDLVHDFNISFVQEESPCGTAGSLSILEGKISSTFFVSNADVLIDANYADMVRFHKENKNRITAVCSMKHFPIPYGVVEIENGGRLKGVREKPELDHLVLTGLYVVEPEMIRLVPRGEVFHMTHLIEKLLREDEKIGVYPIAERAWTDIGEFGSYQDTLQRFR